MDHDCTPINPWQILMLFLGLLAILEWLYLPPPQLPSENPALGRYITEQEVKVHKQREKLSQDGGDGRRQQQMGLGEMMSGYDQQVLIRQNAVRIYQEICEDYDNMVSRWQQFTALKENYLDSVLGTRTAVSKLEPSAESCAAGPPVPAAATASEVPPNAGNNINTREKTGEAGNEVEQKASKGSHHREKPERPEGGDGIFQNKRKEVKRMGISVAPVPSTYYPDTREPSCSKLAKNMSE